MKITQGPLHRRVLLFWMLALTTGASLGLQLVRQAWTQEGRFWNIAWDLFLAWAPLAAAITLEWVHRHRQQRNWLVMGALFVLWLLFFPNAPYLVTEFVHLSAHQNAVWWCDLIVILLIAWNGVLLGFASLYVVQQVIRDHLGDIAGWLTAAACLGLASLGITMGRFERLNSWDALAHPESILRCFSQFADPRTFDRNIGLAVLLGGMLLLQYVTLAALISAVRGIEKRGEPL